MAQMKVRYLLIKNLASGVGHYWNPTKKMRAAGMVAVDLGPDPVEAHREADKLNRHWDEMRKGSTGPIRGSMAWLILQHERSPRFKARSKAANEEVTRAAKRIAVRFGRYQVAAIARKHVRDFYDQLLAEGSLHRANAILKWLRYLLFEAIDMGLIETNPAAKMRIQGTPARDVIWADKEIGLLETAAIAMGRPSVALAIRLACDLGQRQGDVLRLPWSAYDGVRVTLRQSKTKKPIAVAVLPELKARLDAMPRKSPLMVIGEPTGRPYRKLQFNRMFREALAKVATAEGKQYRDLRRTAAVRLTEAGCTVQEVSAICGWSIAYTAAILKVYVPTTTPMADHGIAKLGEHRKKGKTE